MLAVFHLLKNGGTTIVDRYKHNQKFVYQRVTDQLVWRYQQPDQYTIAVADMKTLPSVVFGHGVTFDWNKLSTKPVKYATILRDPCERIISAYNYFKLEMHTIHDTRTDIDFKTWFINRSRLLPTPVFYQWQAFADVSNRCYATEFGKEIDVNTMKQDYKTAMSNIKKFDHILFMDDNYVEKFDDIAEQYELTPNTSVTHTHNTKTDLKSIGQNYTTLEDLDKEDKAMLFKHLSNDFAFYDYCRTL